MMSGDLPSQLQLIETLASGILVVVPVEANAPVQDRQPMQRYRSIRHLLQVVLSDIAFS
jgi:hypothetical protein